MEQEVEDLIINNVNLIYMILKKMGLYNNSGIDKYYDVGMVGLVKGANNYNNNLGIKPSTFLSKCIMNAILMERRRESKRLCIDNTISLNTPIHENIYLEDVISSELDILKDLETEEDSCQLYSAIENLDSVERYIIIHYFGLYGFEPMKQVEIAKELGIAANSISRIKYRAINRLRGILNENEVRHIR